MNDTTTKPVSVPFSKKAAYLLKEYGQKLNDLLREARRVQKEIDANSGFFGSGPVSLRKELDLVKDLFARLQWASEKLIRQVSARIEHGRLSDLSRVELSLRLGEFEHAFLALERIFPMGLRPKPPAASNA